MRLYVIHVTFIQGLKLDKGGHIEVNEFQDTNVPNVHALGDVCGKALLTPGMLSELCFSYLNISYV